MKRVAAVKQELCPHERGRIQDFGEFPLAEALREKKRSSERKRLY
jgi:hypothetical protein